MSTSYLTCTACGAAAEVPEDRDHRGLWEAGWRWIGTLRLFSCPACPPVVVVDQDGAHRRGPGAGQRQPFGQVPSPGSSAVAPNT